MTIENNFEFGGIGVKLVMRNNKVTVISVVGDTPTPAAKWAGIQAGDVIVSVHGVPLTGKTLHEAAALIRGEPGTYIFLIVAREGEKGRKNIHARRANIKISRPEMTGVLRNDTVRVMKEIIYGKNVSSVSIGDARVEVNADGKQVTAYTSNGIEIKSPVADAKKGFKVSICKAFNAVVLNGVVIEQGVDGHLIITTDATVIHKPVPVNSLSGSL